VEAAVAKAEEAWKSSQVLDHSEIETRERERGARALTEGMARLERTEAALAEAKSELEIERERTAVQLAETTARFEKAQTALAEANGRIKTMRDPANEAELHRLRNEIANLQVAQTDREAELALALAAARKARERGADQARAAVLKAEDDWRREEERRLEAAKLDWERQARFAAEMAGVPEGVSESSATKRTNRLFVDSVLVVAFAAAVVLGLTIYWRGPAEGLSNTSAAPPSTPIQHPTSVAAQSPVSSVTATNPVSQAMVTTLIARVRTAPATSASVAGTLGRGVQVSLLERRGQWVRVHVDSQGGKPGLDGWIFVASLHQSPPR
jgi:hypothetical protein